MVNGSFTENSWLYEPDFPEGWTRASLHSLARWTNGMAFRDTHFSSRGRPIIKIAEIKMGISGQTKFTDSNYDSAFFVCDGDMLFSWSGQPETSIDVFRWHGADGWLNQHIFKVEPRREMCDPEFFFYLLKYLKPNFIAIARNKQTTGLGHVTRRDLVRITVAVPPPEIQQAIAHVLGTLDDKIELNRRQNQTLEELARALFTSWFVTFDPVRAKAAGRQPEGMDVETSDLFPSSLQSTKMGQLPTTWSIRSLSDLVNLNALSLGKGDFLDPIKYVEISEVHKGDIGNTPTYHRGQEPSRARRRLRHGDSVISTVRPDRGSYFLCINPAPNLVASTGFAVLTPRTVHWSFVYAAVTQPAVFEYLGQLADGAAYPAVRPDVIGDWQIVVPYDPRIIGKFAQVAGPLFERAEANRRESRAIAQIRDALLPRLLSGELGVPHVQEPAEEVP